MRKTTKNPPLRGLLAWNENFKTRLPKLEPLGLDHIAGGCFVLVNSRNNFDNNNSKEPDRNYKRTSIHQALNKREIDLKIAIKLLS